MTPDPERFAALLAGYCLDVQPGQQVLVRSTTQAAPLLLALQREILEREYCQIEKLHNLGALPAATGFTVSCLPVKVAGASAGWCRAAAILQ